MAGQAIFTPWVIFRPRACDIPWGLCFTPHHNRLCPDPSTVRVMVHWPQLTLKLTIDPGAYNMTIVLSLTPLPITTMGTLTLTLNTQEYTLTSFNIAFELMKLGIYLILNLIGRTNKFHTLGPIIKEVVTCRHFLLAFY